MRVSGPGEKKVRLDADWLTRRVTEWLELPAVRHGVDVVLSDLCRTRGERIVVPGNGSEVSARDTALVTWVCERTAQPVGYAVLLEQACGSFPRLTTAQVDAALFQLVRHGFLLTSITPQDLDDALYDRIAAAVAPVPGWPLNSLPYARRWTPTPRQDPARAARRGAGSCG